MPMAGPKQTGLPTRDRNPRVTEWKEIEAIPFKGGPRLPPQRPDDSNWPSWTRKWWSVVSAMPHCILWDDMDWRFAMETAVLVARFHEGSMGLATEIRNREKVLGTTMDFRRDLRIKYVEPKKKELPAEVTDIANYRDL